MTLNLPIRSQVTGAQVSHLHGKVLGFNAFETTFPSISLQAQAPEANQIARLSFASLSEKSPLSHSWSLKGDFILDKNHRWQTRWQAQGKEIPELVSVFFNLSPEKPGHYKLNASGSF
ncbi:hypothetical protein AVO41_01065 [Thiomicrospira sp. WB1]|nr:hypothetical protein AVO41_01065 [Thiomicrospira sp. WB1]